MGAPTEFGRERPEKIQMARDISGAQRGSAGLGELAPGVLPARTGILRKEGEYWTVGFGGKYFRLKDSKGLGYLAHLLRHPGVEFHVLDLFGGIASPPREDESRLSRGPARGDNNPESADIHITRLSDAGEMLDEQAKLSYRRRLSDLRGELEEAKKQGNVERAERAEWEIDALTSELSRAVGLGGRNRRAASASERARQNITKTLKALVERIAQNDTPLGDILSQCIKTGTFCSYRPISDAPILWEFAQTGAGSPIEPAVQPISRAAPAAGHADHPILERSPFWFAERTAFVGRESERRAIRAVIDRADWPGGCRSA